VILATVLRKEERAMPQCPICDHNDFTLISNRIREGEGRIAQCDHCGLVIQDLDWDAERLIEYYHSEYQSTNSLVTGLVQSPQQRFDDRLPTIQPIFNRIRPLLQPGHRVLEVGCGPGELLWLINPQVARCVGVDLYPPFVEFMQEKLGIEAYAEDINRLAFDEPFDLVICISTLEHLPNPLETLLTMKNLLSPSGKLYVEVPNSNEALNFFLPSSNRQKFNEFFWHRAHLFYFTEETIDALFKKAGMQTKITCRHEYTLKNFLNWYFLGCPQPSFKMGVLETQLFTGNSDFEVRMNNMFAAMETEFKSILAETLRGDTLCCIGWVL
jgi:2-polyprenyl-3-methyl-5-hydroxy-6-metoxy-1,4-benzoquinol methylase